MSKLAGNMLNMLTLRYKTQKTALKSDHSFRKN